MLGDLHDRQEMAHGLSRMAAYEVKRAMMGAPEMMAFELLVRLEREIAIGVEQKLDALPQLLVAQKQRVGRRFGFHHVFYEHSVCAGRSIERGWSR